MGMIDVIVIGLIFVIPLVLWIAASIRVTFGIPYEDRRYSMVGPRGSPHYSSPDTLACGARVVTALAWRAQQS